MAVCLSYKQSDTHQRSLYNIHRVVAETKRKLRCYDVARNLRMLSPDTTYRRLVLTDTKREMINGSFIAMKRLVEHVQCVSAYLSADRIG